MTDSIRSETGKSDGDELVLLQMVERFNLMLLVLLTAGSWYLIDGLFAQSVLIGGALSGGSFFFGSSEPERSSPNMPQERRKPVNRSTSSCYQRVSL
jgi:hypothetical protein